MKATPAPLQFGEPDHGCSAETGIGRHIEIRLPENPTTGFRWHVAGTHPPVCALLADTFEPGRQPGQPGVHRWQFKTIAAGSTSVELVYRRAWEPDTPPARTFSLHLRVRPDESSKSPRPDPHRSRKRRAT